MFQCYSLKSSHPRLLPHISKVCFLHLCLFCCLAYRVIVTIFLNSILLLLLSHFSHVQLCATPYMAANQAPRPWGSPGKNTGVGCHFLLQCMKVKRESEIAQSCQLLATPWTAAYQAPPSMGFSRQEYWSGVTLPSPALKYRPM